VRVAPRLGSSSGLAWLGAALHRSSPRTPRLPPRSARSFAGSCSASRSRAQSSDAVPHVQAARTRSHSTPLALRHATGGRGVTGARRSASPPATRRD
jgi:hypothetical protein